MDDVELREFRYFIAVAEELNFTRAAERLGIAQPPLSAAIRRIERKLGVTLFHRTSRQVRLTRAGDVLLEQGRIVLEAANAAVERTKRAATRGDLITVAVKPGADTELLQGLVRRCSADPTLPDVELLFGHPGGPAAAVRGGAADVAVLHAPFDRRGLDTELLLVESRVVVLPAGHRLAHRRELSCADLVGEPMPQWTGQSDPAAARYWTGSEHPAQAGAGPRINGTDQLLDAVALGNVIAYVPTAVARQQRRDSLVFVPVTDLSPSELLVAWPSASRSRVVAEFVRTAVELASGPLIVIENEADGACCPDDEEVVHARPAATDQVRRR